jgi:NAD-dependent deacetylase
VDDVRLLAELIRARGPCVALTGAGVSTESGIPDFRSPSGMWATVDPREYASLSAFRRNPERVWSFYATRYRMLVDAEPNRAHRALAELEHRGLIEAVVTQNIDLLHERAGSEQVVEVHGSIRTASCTECGRRHSLEEVLELLAGAGAGTPRCTHCGGVLKPDVVFFEELLPESELERAFELARRARLLLVVGSSLEVYPVAGLPDATLAAGGDVAIVNRGSTPFDSRARVLIDVGAGDVLAEVVRLLR